MPKPRNRGHANSRPPPHRHPGPRHRVVVLALDGVIPFDLGIPARLFGAALGPDLEPLYEVVTCGLTAGPVTYRPRTTR